MTQQEPRPKDKLTDGSVLRGLYVLCAIIFLFLVAYELFQDFRLALSGKSTAAMVVDYTPTRTKKGGVIHWHSMEAPDGQVLRVTFDAPQPPGTRVSVTYLPDSPDVVRVGNASASRIRFLLDQITWGTSFLVALGLGFAWVGFAKGREEKLLQARKKVLGVVAVDKIRVVIVVVIIALLGTLLYPPFIIQRPIGSRHAGFDWIFSSRLGTVDVSLLLAEWLAILLVAGLVIYLVKPRR